jgi:hypothetical protein
VKITTTKEGSVSFLQMTPDLAMLLVHLASDLVDGAALQYDDGHVYVLTDNGRDEIAKLAKAYDKPTTRVPAKGDWPDFWSAPEPAEATT